MDSFAFKREKNLLKGWFWWHKNAYKIWGFPSGIKLLYLVLGLGFLLIVIIAFPSPWYIIVFLLLGLGFFCVIDFLPYVALAKFSPVYRINFFRFMEHGIIFGSTERQQNKLFYKDINKISYTPFHYFAGAGIGSLIGGRVFYYLFLKRAHFSIEYSTSEGLGQHFPVPPDLPQLSSFLKMIIQRANLKKVKPGEWVKTNEKISLAEVEEEYLLYPSPISPKQLKVSRNFIIFLIILFLALLILLVIAPYLP